MQFWVYILRCRDGSYYTGHTDDLEKRLWQHREGKMWDWTATRYEALEFERRVKNWSRAKKEALIAGDRERVGYFAKPPHERSSTTLGTNEFVGLRPDGQQGCDSLGSFVPSLVEGCSAVARAGSKKSE
jgi:predicted GIY-YIG superfamily endonuclease